MRKSQPPVVPGQSAWIFSGPPVEAGEKPHPLGSGNNSSPEGTDGTDWYKVGVWAFLRRTFMIFIYVLLSNFQVQIKEVLGRDQVFCHVACSFLFSPFDQLMESLIFSAS